MYTSDKYNIDNLKILSKLHSKRNNVYKAEASIEGKKTLVVVKNYSGQDGEYKCTNEFENLLRLNAAGIDVPKILAKDNAMLLLSYIDGDTVCSLVEKLDLGDWIEQLALWLAKLHKVQNANSCFLKGDANLNNFIFSNGKIYGLDFEEKVFGDYLEDLGQILFFVLTNSPSYTYEKSIIVRKLLKSYIQISGNNINEISKYILKSKTDAYMRRRKYLYDAPIKLGDQSLLSVPWFNDSYQRKLL